MGGAIARGLTQGTLVKAENITVSDLNQKTLDALKAFNEKINITSDSKKAIDDADIIITKNYRIPIGGQSLSAAHHIWKAHTHHFNSDADFACFWFRNFSLFDLKHFRPARFFA